MREDVETFGRHANVRFGRDWRADAERRDFTMNALSVAADGVVHDYVGGLADLEARRVRFIGDARKAHRRGLSAHPALLPLPRRLWPWAARCRGACRLHRRARRSRAIVARAGADGIAQAAAGAARDAGARVDGGGRAAACRCWAAFPISRASRTWPRSRRRRACRRMRCSGSARSARASPRMPSGCGSGCASPTPSTSGSLR